MSTTTKTQPTLRQFKQWSKDCAPAARAVLMARVFAEMERERVDAYIAPIFARYIFPVRERFAPNYGERVKCPKDLYLCEEEDLCANYFEDCDQAHRAHGFTGPKGHCPALTAEHLLIQAEHALMSLAESLTGIEPHTVHFENRVKYLELLIGACLKAEQEAA